MQIKKVLAFLGFILPVGGVLLLYSYLGTYARFMADDYCSFYDAKRLDVLRYIWFWYITWGGRYAAIATDNLIEYIGPGGVRFVPFAVLLLWVAASSLMFRQVLKNKMAGNERWMVSISMGMALVFAVLAASPQSPQVMYWWNGMRTYIPAIISFTLHMAFLAWAVENLESPGGVFLGAVISFLLALFSGGYNETFTAIQVMLFAAWIGILLWFRRMRFGDRAFRLVGAAMLGAGLALIIMVLSPGAAKRQALFPPHPGMIAMLHITMDGYLRYLTGMFHEAGKAWALIGAILVSIWAGAQGMKKPVSWWMIWMPFAGAWLLSFSSLLPSAYGLSEMPAPRTFIVPTFLLVLGLVYAGLMLGGWINDRGWTLPAYRETAWMLVAVAVIVFSAGLNGQRWYGAKDQYASFARLWDQTDALILQARQNHDKFVTIPAMDNWAGLERPTPSKKYWPNVCFTSYYGIQVYGPRYSNQ